MTNLEGKSFGERFSYYAQEVAKDNGCKNLGEMAGSAMQRNMTCGAGAGPALVVLIKTIASYFD